MLRTTLIALSMAGLMMATPAAQATSLGSPKSTTPRHERMDKIDDLIYERIAFAALKPTRPFRYVSVTKGRTTSNGETTNETTRNPIELLSFDDRIIRRRFTWTSQSGETGTTTTLFALNGLLQIWSRTDRAGAEPSVSKITSAVGSLFPFVVGAKLKVIYDNDPSWADEDYVENKEYEVLEKFPAGHIHGRLTGDAFKIRVNSTTLYKENNATSSTSVAHYALVKDLGYAFILDLDYKGADTDYKSYSKTTIEDFEYLD